MNTALVRAWMKLAGFVHDTISPLVMGIVFFGVFTPVALAMRAIGRDAFARSREPAAPTYWKRRDPPSPAHRR